MRKLIPITVAGVVASLASAQTIAVSAAFAANASSLSPSFAPWAANALQALATGTNTAGSLGAPSYYENVAGQAFDSRTNVVTDFQSFRGVAPGPFADEYGTRMHFPVKITAAAVFTLADVTYDMNSNDAGNAFDFDGDLSGLAFGVRRRGVFYGANGVLGGGDDVVYDSSNPGSDATPINELEYVGIGNALEALSTSAGATNQSRINGVASAFGAYTLSTTYAIRGRGASATTSVRFSPPVPEPATLAGLGLGALGLFRRRRARRRSSFRPATRNV